METAKAVGTGRRVAAIASIPLLVGSVGVVLVALQRNFGVAVFALLALAVIAASAWWWVTERGLPRRVAGIGVALGLIGLVLAVVAVLSRPLVAAPVVLLILFGIVAAEALARFALVRPVPGSIQDGRPGGAPQRAVLLCNPWSGGGKVDQFDLVRLAEEMGVEPVVLGESDDLEQLTRDAVARGADCLGMAGGDGSQALVASVAAEHDLPFVCIPAGTRNHFALDLGLDRNDPRAAMAGFADAVERRVDLGVVNDRVFVNNVSLGVYATIVQSDDYRDAKAEVSRSMLTDLLGRQAEPFDLQYTTPDGTVIDGAFLIMVSNNPYVLHADPDFSQRRYLDSGRLGVLAMSTRTGGQAARLVTLSALGVRDISKYWYEFTDATFEVCSRSGTTYLGVDGEALEDRTPLRFSIRPGALRMLVPRGNLHRAEWRRARDVSVTGVFSVALGREPVGKRASV